MYEGLSKYIGSRIEFCKNESRSTLEKNWAEWLKSYRQYVKSGSPGHTKIGTPIVFSHAFRLYAAIGSNIQQNPDIATFVSYPKFSESDIVSTDYGETMQQVSNYYVAKYHAIKEMLKTVHEAIVLGTSFCKITWEVEYEDVQEESDTGSCPQCGIFNGLGDIKCPCGQEYSVREDGEGFILDYKEKVKDNPKYEHRPLKSIYFDPKVNAQSANVKDMEWIVDARWMSMDALKSNKKFKNLDAVEDKSQKKSTEQNPYETIDQAIDDINGISTVGVEQRDEESDMVLVYDYYGKAPRALLNPKLIDYKYQLKDFIDVHVVLANGIVIYADINPYGQIPYAVCRCYKDVGYFYGIGIPELLSDMARVLKGLINQRMDNVSLVLNRMWMYRQGTVNPKTLQSKPGGLIPYVGDPTSLVPVPTPDVTSSSYQEQSQLLNLIERTDGLAEVFFGESASNTRKTLGAVTLETELGAGMIQRVVADMVQDFFIPFMELHRDNILRFMEDPIVLNQDGKAILITPDEINGKYELIPSVGEQMFTKQAELQKNLMLAQQTMQYMQPLMLQGYEIDFAAQLEDIYKSVGKKNFKKIVKQGGQNGTARQGVGGQTELLNALPGSQGSQGDVPATAANPATVGAVQEGFGGTYQ